MVNILVVEDNIILSRQIINCISMKNQNIRLYSLALTGKEAISIINHENIDLILLDLNLPDISGIEILEMMKNKNMHNYEKSIIVFSGEVDMISKVIDSPYVFSYIYKSFGISKVIESIEQFINYRDLEEFKISLKGKINNELEYISYNFVHKGTQYLAEIIYEIYTRRDICGYNLKKDIYPIIAKKHKTTEHNIKCNIIHATNAMYYECEEEKLMKYLHYYTVSKPKPKEIIFTILNRLIQED